MWADSVSSPRRNFFRAGTLKNNPLTSIDVPSGAPLSVTASIFVPVVCISVPTPLSEERVTNRKRDTLAILGKASPRKPMVATVARSPAARILLVACRSRLIKASSRSIPHPSSMTRIHCAPPLANSTSIFFAPASMLFSTSSFTMDAGRSTTSPAATWLATSSVSSRIFPMQLTLHGFVLKKRT